MGAQATVFTRSASISYTTPQYRNADLRLAEGPMPHSPEDKKRAITRLRRIRGQAEALERTVEEGAACGAVLQQLAAIKGAVNGLMADVLQGHLRETFGDPDKALDDSIDETLALMRSYLR